MQDSQIIQADLTWTGEKFEPDIQVVVSDTGHIVHVGALDVKPTTRLHHRALLPGMVNAHSHAFQRGLRGRGESFPEGAGSFWTWREEMYRLVSSMTADRIYELSHQAFKEMLAAGITSVGEFHYLHHDSTCAGFALDQVVLTAAADAGIRIALLAGYYQNGGINKPLSQAQRRFRVNSPADFWRQFDLLEKNRNTATQSLGVVAHSVRAVPPNALVELHKEAFRRDLVFHIHVEEQPKEIEECIAAYGKTPMALLTETLHINERFTAIHCTHTAAEDMIRFTQAGGNVCMCPLTEANLGDGIADLPGMLRAGGRICIGTDSNARISLIEELRWLEYVQRLRHESRGMCVNASGDSASALLEIGTSNGATSLGLNTGRIEPGYLADLITLDLKAPSLAEWSVESLLTSFLFGAGNDAIRETCVGGRWVRPPRDSIH